MIPLYHTILLGCVRAKPLVYDTFCLKETGRYEGFDSLESTTLTSWQLCPSGLHLP